MQRIKSMDNSASLPAPDVNSYDPGYFQDGNAAIAKKGTVVSATWANGVQEELIKVITEAGITPSDADNTQLWQALRYMIFNAAYPVGSIYMSALATSPATLFGFGTWQQIKGCFLMAAGSGYSLGSTGGAATVTLSVANMPSHAHGVTCATGGSVSAQTLQTQDGGAHAHTVTIAVNTHTHAKSTITCQNTGNHKHGPGTYEITGTMHLTSTGKGHSGSSGAFSLSDTSEYGGDDQNGKSRQELITFRASNTWDGQSGSAGAHDHDISISASGSHAHTATCANSITHKHSVTVPAVAAHSHTVTVQNNGSGQAFSILPPYKAVNVWQRIA